MLTLNHLYFRTFVFICSLSLCFIDSRSGRTGNSAPSSFMSKVIPYYHLLILQYFLMKMAP